MKFKRYSKKKVKPKALSLDFLTVLGVNKPSHAFKNLLSTSFFLIFECLYKNKMSLRSI